jgi:hypothetical protein
MKAPSSIKQRTINVNGDIIKIKSRRKTSQANHVGFKVQVNEHDYFFAVLTHSEAIEKAYVRYIKENR